MASYLRLLVFTTTTLGYFQSTNVDLRLWWTLRLSLTYLITYKRQITGLLVLSATLIRTRRTNV